MGEMTKERMGTASMPVDGSPPFERPTKNDPSAAKKKYDKWRSMNQRCCFFTRGQMNYLTDFASCPNNNAFDFSLTVGAKLMVLANA